MAEGTLLVGTRFTVLDGTGVAVSGAQIATFVAGTNTPLATYSDVNLTVANANPTIADSAGRAVLFLTPGVAYKIVVNDAAGALLYSQDNVFGGSGAGGSTSPRTTVGGRISGVAGNAVIDVTNGVVIVYTPYLGNQIGLYNGTSWTTLTFAETSLALGADTANKNYDLFGYSNSGTFALERLAWTNDSTRATALTTQDGVLVKTGDATRRYLGTYRTNTSAGHVTDDPSVRGIWNYYNRVRRAMRVLEATDTWNYTLLTLRKANNSDANRLGVVIGVAESTVEVIAASIATNASVTNFYTSIGEDSTSATAAGTITQPGITSTFYSGAFAILRTMPAAGYHFYCWLEASNALGTTTMFGDNGASLGVQSGLTGSVEA